MRKTDWRKIEKLFCGWGNDNNQAVCKDEMRTIARLVADGRMKYWGNMDDISKRKIKSQTAKLCGMFPVEVWKALQEIKNEAVRHEWLYEKNKLDVKYRWLMRTGGIKLKTSDRSDRRSHKNDAYLKRLCGNTSNEPLVYGGVTLDGDEAVAMMLPPKFSVYEKIDVDQVELESRKTGVKLRWDERPKAVNDGEIDPVKTVKDTSYWLKGSFNVDFSKTRVTRLKGNRMFIIPKPVKDDFEVRWHVAELECLRAAKKVQKKFFITDLGQESM